MNTEALPIVNTLEIINEMSNEQKVLFVKRVLREFMGNGQMIRIFGIDGLTRLYKNIDPKNPMATYTQIQDILFKYKTHMAECEKAFEQFCEYVIVGALFVGGSCAVIKGMTRIGKYIDKRYETGNVAERTLWSVSLLGVGYCLVSMFR